MTIPLAGSNRYSPSTSISTTGPTPRVRAVPGYGLTGKPLLAVGAPWGGLYQVNFIVPPPPAGTILAECDGNIIRSNLTVTLSGVRPQPEQPEPERRDRHPNS